MNQSLSLTHTPEERWFVLNYISKTPAAKGGAAEDCVRRFNDREKIDLEVFMPTFVDYNEKEEKRKVINRPLLFHYAFIKGSFPQLKKLCGESNSFSFVLNPSSENRYAFLDDVNMKGFMMISRKYSNKVPFYSIQGVDLQDWDKVEVVDGDFSGLIGYFLPYKGGKKGRVVLKLSQNMATFAYDINVNYIRVLEFSRNFKRVYDLIDAFVPKLYKAMRKFASGESLDEKEISGLHSFCRRMGKCETDNPKIEAKLWAILSMANRILGNDEEEQLAQQRLEKREHSVTSPVTKAFISLLDAVAYNDSMSLQLGLDWLSKTGEKKSKAIDELRAEYEFYKGSLT